MNGQANFNTPVYPNTPSAAPQAGLVTVVGTACREVLYESRGTVLEVAATLTVGVAS